MSTALTYKNMFSLIRNVPLSVSFVSSDFEFKTCRTKQQNEFRIDYSCILTSSMIMETPSRDLFSIYST